MTTDEKYLVDTVRSYYQNNSINITMGLSSLPKCQNICSLFSTQHDQLICVLSPTFELFCKVGDRVRFLSFIHCARSNHSMVVMYRSLVLQRGQKLGPPKISSVIFIPSSFFTTKPSLSFYRKSRICNHSHSLPVESAFA